MKRRAGKREGAARKKSPALTQITREIIQKHWRANNHYNVCKRFELRFMAACFRAQTKTVDYLLDRTTSSRTLFSTGRACALAMIWVWFLNLDSGEVVEMK